MHEYIAYVADRAASREVDALHDYYGVGRLVVAGDVTYDQARDQLVAAFAERGLQGSTAKVYVSQGYALAQLFDTFADVEDYADECCKGSRSLKRIYDQTRRDAKGEDDSAEGGEGEGEGDAPELAAPTSDADRADAILAILGAMTDAAAIARVRDAAAAMLTPAAVAI